MTKLPYLDQWTAKRRELAERYDEKLAPLDVKTPIEAAGAKHVYHLYVIEVANRDRVLNRLQSNGVMAQVHYPSVVHLQECYADLGFGEGDFPVTETAAANMLSLPMYAELTDEQMDYTVNTLAEAI
jgi:dTDP-4-amino-4,6-dideoxygalactose transaminase